MKMGDSRTASGFIPWKMGILETLSPGEICRLVSGYDCVCARFQRVVDGHIASEG